MKRPKSISSAFAPHPCGRPATATEAWSPSSSSSTSLLPVGPACVAARALGSLSQSSKGGSCEGGEEDGEKGRSNNFNDVEKDEKQGGGHENKRRPASTKRRSSSSSSFSSSSLPPSSAASDAGKAKDRKKSTGGSRNNRTKKNVKREAMKKNSVDDTTVSMPAPAGA